MALVQLFTSFSTLEANSPEELEAVQETFGPLGAVELLADLKPGALVIPRFRAIPFGDLLEAEIKNAGCTLINTFAQHATIANTYAWTHLLDGSDGRQALTPRSYGLDAMAYLPEGEWFVKGETNSLKNQWLQASYAPTTKALPLVVSRLLEDAYVGSQAVVIKPFQKYRRLATAVNHQPVFHERRAFVLDGKVLTDAFYWTSWEDEIGPVTYDEAAYQTVLLQAIERVNHLARFMVIDLAEYEDNSWGVVELNDGSMSGLSSNDATTLWQNFKKQI